MSLQREERRISDVRKWGYPERVGDVPSPTRPGRGSPIRCGRVHGSVMVRRGGARRDCRVGIEVAASGRHLGMLAAEQGEGEIRAPERTGWGMVGRDGGARTRA